METRTAKNACRMLYLLLVASTAVAGQDMSKPCPTVMTTVARSPAEVRGKENIVEVRTCDGNVLQLVAWGKASKAPLVIETGRTSIVAMVFAAWSVFVFETAGASSNVLQVITFPAGKPVLSYSDAYKAFAEIHVSAKAVDISIPNPGGEIKRLRYATGIE